ncbi:hypothetical protein [Geodermatophilus sp. SYSU D00684]
MTGSGEQGAARSRRRLLLGAGGAVLVALVALALVLTGGGGDDGTATAATPGATTTATATATPAAPTTAAPEETVAPPPATPTPTGPTEDVDEPPPSLPEVPLDAPAAVGNGIVATIGSIEAIDGTGVGPGNIAGPALRVTVRIENGTADAVSLDGVAVNLSHGPERTPASPLEDPSHVPFVGTVEPGETGEGVYVFSVPADARDSVTVEVGYQAGAPLLLLTGAV